MTAETLFITTAIDYVNGKPHLGHAYEKMATDAIARAFKAMQIPTYFLTGVDEHGLKVEQNAAQHGQSPKAFVDELSQSFAALWQHCDVAYDRFIRTTEAQHYAVVSQLWERMHAKGDIYKASYEGHYCTGCEAFLTERDLDETGACLIHKKKPQVVLEENYFFRLSRYKQALLDYFEAHPDFVQPQFRKTEVLNMLEHLQDISVSRSTKSVTWGIPVPNDPEQVIYVWIDALSNYLTGLNYLSDDDALYQRFWKTPSNEANAVHIIGKDILRFHAIYWPALLMSAELPLPKLVFAHGFITLEDAKISKSFGNVISPFEITETFELPNADTLRYYLLTCTPFGQDGNFSIHDFKLKVNADLANNLGNLLNRSLSMVVKYFEGHLPPCQGHRTNTTLDALRAFDALQASVEEAYRAFDFQKVASLLLERVDLGNRSINDLEPWALYKAGKTEALADLMYSILESLRIVAILFAPLLPNLSADILTQLGFDARDFQYFNALDTERFSSTLPHTVRPTGPLIPRLDSELIGAEKKK
ncbi:MAG: methionine--tRNA ligase [Vampirovibrio sp.]